MPASRARPMFWSWPDSAFVAGVKIGSASCSDSMSAFGSSSPATVPSALYSVHAEPEMYPRATHSMSMRSQCCTSTARPASDRESRKAFGKRRRSVEMRWFGTIRSVLRNQKFESCVRTRPLSGIRVERRHLQERTRPALGLEREPAHRFVGIGMAVFGEEDIERLGRDRAARHRQVRLEAITVDAHAVERRREPARRVGRCGEYLAE